MHSLYDTNAVDESNTELNSEYDPFAAIYDRYWGEEYHAQALPVVERLLLSRLPQGASVLDVCCGTGKFTATVRQLGFDVAGIDASQAMLSHARRNAPEIDFVLADARSFSLGRKFDAAYSVFESLNHLPDLQALHAAFLHVREHLRRGTWFLFDLNREDAFLTQWNETNAIVDAENVCVTRSEYDEEKGKATCDVTVFELEKGRWLRRDFTLRQTCHKIDAVQEMLSSSGFASVALYDAGDMGMDEHTGYARTFFLAAAS